MPDLLRTSVVVLLTGATLAGCGGSSTLAGSPTSAAPQPAASSTGPQALSSASVGPGASGAPAASGGSAPAGPRQPSGAASQAGSPAPAPSYARITLNAKLSKTCVTPGDSLTLTLDSHPGMYVIVDTRYPDGKDGQVYGGYDDKGHTDAKGHYELTWQVSPLTPVGAADTQIGAVDRSSSGTAKLPFKVARTCG